MAKAFTVDEFKAASATRFRKGERIRLTLWTGHEGEANGYDGAIGTIILVQHDQALGFLYVVMFQDRQFFERIPAVCLERVVVEVKVPTLLMRDSGWPQFAVMAYARQSGYTTKMIGTATWRRPHDLHDVVVLKTVRYLALKGNEIEVYHEKDQSVVTVRVVPSDTY